MQSEVSGVKKAISLLLCFSLLWTACCPYALAESATLSVPEFSSLGDPALLPYMEDTLYEGLVSTLNSDEYFVENVSAVYISQEYLDELAYNSQANIYFGYTLAELNEQFQGTRYIFTLGENNETVVVPFEDYDDTFERVIQNVAVGTGVILVCVTVSVVTAGAGAYPTALIFACAAKTGTTCALSGAAISATLAGIVTGVKTGDMSNALKSAALAGSEGFKWGAITGAIAGGISTAIRLTQNPSVVLTPSPRLLPPLPRESEEYALNLYGGREQVTFLNGEEVSYITPGATRPDIIRVFENHLEAIEVKNYDLSKPVNRSEMYSILKKEISDRMIHLPEGSTQRIAIDVRGKGYPDDLLKVVDFHIRKGLKGIYDNIPIDFLK